MPLRLFTLAALLAAAPAFAQGQALEIGASLPMAGHAMTSTTGSAVTFDQAMGPRGLAVVFWCNTCPWVIRYEQRVIDLAREFGNAGIGFVLVNPNDPATSAGDDMDAMRQRVADHNYPMPYVVDAGSQAARAFGATRTPQVFLFDENRRLVYEGTVDDSPSDAAQAEARYFRDALLQVVAGEPVAVEKTRAFGCTIKFYE